MLRDVPLVFPISLAIIVVMLFFTGAYAISENALEGEQVSGQVDAAVGPGRPGVAGECGDLRLSAALVSTDIGRPRTVSRGVESCRPSNNVSQRSSLAPRTGTGAVESCSPAA